jgi:hypothetical protein
MELRLPREVRPTLLFFLGSDQRLYFFPVAPPEFVVHPGKIDAEVVDPPPLANNEGAPVVVPDPWPLDSEPLLGVAAVPVFCPKSPAPTEPGPVCAVLEDEL